MAGMGPSPNPNARRRNKRPAARVLPAAGRPGGPPEFPLAGSSKVLVQLWAELWSSPQAVAWERFGWARLVARYAKLLLAAEKRDATAALLAEVRQLEDRLGLSPMAMKRLGWEVEDVPAEQPAGVTSLVDYRERTG